MGKTRRSIRLAGATAAIAGASAMAAPASADVTGVEVTTPSGYGSSEGVYGPGCEYTVEATVNNQNLGEKVTFTVTSGGATVETEDVTPTGNSAKFTWTPDGPGSYVITAKQPSSAAKSTDPLTVGTFAISNENLSDGTCIVIY